MQNEILNYCVWEIEQNNYFIQFCSTNFSIEQIYLHFYSTILYFKDNGVLIFFEFWVLRVLFIIPTQNGEMIVLFNKFHRGTNLVALLFCNLGLTNKTTYSKFINFEF
jgi:hypothetical protein